MLRTTHTDVGGVEHLGLGYGGCALPLVLDHNTPNNSVALLWAETEAGSAMAAWRLLPCDHSFVGGSVTRNDHGKPL